MVKHACQDFKNWLASVKEYKKAPDKFLGAPQMPHYKKKGSVSGLHFTNQDCVIRDNNGKSYLKFPHFHGDYLPIGYVSGSLKEVRVRPYYSAVSYTHLDVYKRQDPPWHLRRQGKTG